MVVVVVKKGNLWLFPDDKKIIVKEWYILQGIKLTDLGRTDHNLKSDGDGDHIVHVIDLNACTLWVTPDLYALLVAKM